MGKKGDRPYKRPNKISKYFADQNLRDDTIISNRNNIFVTASNNEKISFMDSSSSYQRHHRKEIEKRINGSQDIQNLIIYLASISMCIGKIYLNRSFMIEI